MSYSIFVGRQITQAITGPVWHGDPLAKLLGDVTPAEAAARPVAQLHTIGELVGHLATWADAARERLEGKKGSRTDAQNFPVVDTSSETAWAEAVNRLTDAYAALAASAAALSPDTLAADLPGRPHSAAIMLHGVVEHAAYHGGQIALLKKIIRGR